jgi:cation-transporting ATPase E
VQSAGVAVPSDLRTGSSRNLLPAAQTPFSSDRKWSSVTFQNLGTVIIGAPERLIEKNTAALSPQLKKYLESSKRVLFAAFASEPVADSKLPQLKIFAAIEIEDEIRKNASATFEYFRGEGVAVKVISGDNPAAVSQVARQAGLENYDSYIDMTDIRSDEEIAAAAKQYTIFGRVTPEQKKQLIIAFKKAGHTAAMVGDGVNDVLALREADCSIALANGSAASKQVAKLVLTESDFTALPSVVAEGRRVINNVTKVSGVFFIKTIYSVLLSVLFIILNQPFPFAPIQITLIDLAIEGYPALFLSFEKDAKKPKGKFLNTAMLSALPFAILILLNVSVLIILQRLGIFPPEQITAMAYWALGIISAAAVFKACWPPNKLRLFLALSSTAGFFAAVWIASMILPLHAPALWIPAAVNLWIPAVMGAVSIPLIWLMAKLLRPKEKKRIGNLVE